MSTRRVAWFRFRSRPWSSFAREDRGNVAMLFALAIIPIVALAGAAVDFSRAAQVQAKLQTAADATALAASKNAPSQTAAQLQAAAQAFFNGNFSAAGAATPAVTATYTAGTSSANPTVTVSATSSITTSFLGIVGINQLQVGASSTTTWGMTRLRLALVLDNTGSMLDSGKIGALKTATTNLLSQLKAAAVNSGDVYVSIIPFTTTVNVGTANKTASWLSFSAWDAVGTGNGSYQQQCTGIWPRRTCTNVWVANDSSHSTWAGCVMDRNQNYDAQNTTPMTDDTTKFPAAWSGTCPEKLMGMTDVLDSTGWTNLNNEVTNMVANGATNQAIGLAWGWQSLTSGAPLSMPAEDANYKYNHVIVILSDGLNTQDRWYGDGSANQSSTVVGQIDAREKLACDNIKAVKAADGSQMYTIYAIQVNTGGDPTSAVLQYCASDTSKFTMLTSSNQIITTFQKIGADLSTLRISN